MSNIYNIATNFRSYQFLHHQKPLQRDLTNHTLNIFKTIELQRLTEKGFISSKNYQVVGYKQIKSLELKTRKATKLSSRKMEATHQRPVSKQSSHKDNKLFTKQEVLLGLPKIQKHKILKKIPSNLRRNSQISQVNDFNLITSKAKKSRINKQFSVSRLKEIIKQRQHEWSKIIQNQRVKRQNEKFPTIYKSIELYRTKIQEKQKKQKFDLSFSQKSSLWEQTLRKKGQQQPQKSVERIIHDESQFLTKGNSKLRLQTEWIQNKDKDCYQFKLISLEKNRRQQKLQSFR